MAEAAANGEDGLRESVKSSSQRAEPGRSGETRPKMLTNFLK